jgi:hypothetical protein
MLDRRGFLKRASALLAACAICRPAAVAADELLEREKLKLPCEPEPGLTLPIGGPIDLGDFIAIDPQGRAIRATDLRQVVGVVTGCKGQRVFVRTLGWQPIKAG